MFELFFSVKKNPFQPISFDVRRFFVESFSAQKKRFIVVFSSANVTQKRIPMIREITFVDVWSRCDATSRCLDDLADSVECLVEK